MANCWNYSSDFADAPGLSPARKLQLSACDDKFEELIIVYQSKAIIFLSSLLILNGCFTVKELSMPPRKPEDVKFVTIEQKSPTADVLRTRAAPLTFPLSTEDLSDIETLKAKFYATENCAGLAAPQIGIGKQIFVYHVDEIAKNYRSDIDEIVPVRVMINPTYTNVSDEKVIDWEACFSVESQYGEVPRYAMIAYEAYDPQGNVIKGTAKGFHARVLQHEIGHLNKELFFDLFTDSCRHGDAETMRAIRMKELADKNKDK